MYYYFKTKEAIGEAVIERRRAEYEEKFARWNDIPNSADRLKAFVKFEDEELELLARYGCAIGGLCQELGKQGGTLADLAAKLLHDILQWTEKQFRTLGFGENSETLALTLVASIQGTHLLTHTFKDPKLANKQSNTLTNWLETTLASSKSNTTQTAAATVY